jgi:hypothetical protein
MEMIQSLIATQRIELNRAFFLLQQYLLERMNQREGEDKRAV